jgi:integrase
MIALNLNKHIYEVTINSQQMTLISIPAHEVKNQEPLEHFLTPQGRTLLKLYLNEYRPIILRKHKALESAALFPGQGGREKNGSTFRKQMNTWIRKHTGLDFHPHAIRKIVPKIILDSDPTALEIARRSGGWKSNKMLLTIYGQRNHRASQTAYLKMLEGRRLNSVPIRSRRQRPAA